MDGKAQDKVTGKGGKPERDPGGDKTAILPPDRGVRPTSDGANVNAKAKKYVPL